MIERAKDEKPFEIYTDARDKIAYYTRIRNSYIITVVMVTLIILFGSTRLGFIENGEIRQIIGIVVKVIAGVLGLAIFLMGMKAQKRLSSLR